MKKGLNNMMIAIGIVIICASIFGYGLDRFGYLNIPDSKLIFVVIAVGIGIIVGGICDAYVKSDGKIKREFEIEANDERNVTINRIAKAFAFDIMTVLFSAAITILALAGRISVGIFFIFFGIYMVTQLAYIYKLRILQDKM